MKKRLVITGSEGRIGKTLVEYFKDKYELLLLDVKSGVNLADEKFVEKWFEENKNLYGLIVCHAYNPVPLKETKKVEPIDIPTSELRDYLDVNVTSAFNINRYFIKNNKKGTIINVSSIYGIVSPKHFLYKDFVKPIGYPVSKSALVAMSKYLATYYAPDIRVNTVSFGGISDPNQDSDFVKKYSENVPMKRLMNLEETVSVFEFLLDEKNTYATGSEFVVDGGWTAW